MHTTHLQGKGGYFGNMNFGVAHFLLNMLSSKALVIKQNMESFQKYQPLGYKQLLIIFFLCNKLRYKSWAQEKICSYFCLLQNNKIFIFCKLSTYNFFGKSSYYSKVETKAN